MADLDELRRMVQSDPAEACSAIAAAIEGGVHGVRRGQLASLEARARLVLGEVDLAAGAATRAIELAGGDVDIEADGRLVRASVRGFGGDVSGAIEDLDWVLTHAGPAQRAHAQLQRGAIEHRRGQLTLAAGLYEDLLDRVRSNGDPLDLANLLGNIGVVDVQRGEISRGIEALGEAQSIFQANGLPFPAAQMVHNIGWAYGRLGDVPTAIAWFDEAVRRFSDLGHSPDESAFERAELLLEAGLWADALAIGEPVARRLEQSGNFAVAADTWALCASACRLGGDVEGALSMAAAAEAAYLVTGNERGAALARLERLRVEAQPPEAMADQAAAVERALSELGDSAGSSMAAALLARALADAGDVELAAAAADRCSQIAGRMGTLPLKLAAVNAIAYTALTANDPVLASRELDRGWSLLAREQSMIPSMHDRAQLSLIAAEAIETGLAVAVARSSPLEFLGVVESAREWTFGLQPARPADPATAALLDRVRSLAAECRAAELEGVDATHLRAERRRSEAKLRTALLHRRSGGAPLAAVDGAERARLDQLVGRTVIAMSVVRDQCFAAVVGPDGGARLIAVGDAGEVDRAGSVAARALWALASPRCPQRARRATMLTSALDRLDTHLGSLAPGDGEIVLLIPPDWTWFPFALLPRWSGRPVVIIPSIRWWNEIGPARSGGNAGICVGPRVTWADHEVDAVSEALGSPIVLRGEQATTAEFARLFGDVETLHVIAHGDLRRDNPMWSSIGLVDGPSFVHDLEQSRSSPSVVVLSACNTALPGAAAGSALSGFAAALLSVRVRSVVGAAGPLADDPRTAEVMSDLHRRIRSGVPVSHALAELVERERSGLRNEVPVACSLACLGHG